MIKTLREASIQTDALGRPHLVFPEDMDEIDLEVIIEFFIANLKQNEKEDTNLKKVKALQDESSHWYVVPDELAIEFDEDAYNEDIIDSGEFDRKWGRYRTGGDLNLIQLWAELKD